MKFHALKVSVYYLAIALLFSLVPALAVSFVIYMIKPEWEAIAFVAVYSWVLTGFLFNRKGNWFS